MYGISIRIHMQNTKIHANFLEIECKMEQPVMVNEIYIPSLLICWTLLYIQTVFGLNETLSRYFDCKLLECFMKAGMGWLWRCRHYHKIRKTDESELACVTVTVVWEHRAWNMTISWSNKTLTGICELELDELANFILFYCHHIYLPVYWKINHHVVVRVSRFFMALHGLTPSIILDICFSPVWPHCSISLSLSLSLSVSLSLSLSLTHSLIHSVPQDSSSSKQVDFIMADL